MLVSSGLDVLSISETWLNENVDNGLITIPGYTCIRHDRKWSENNQVKKGGGVGCYVKNNIQMSHHDFVNFNISTKDIELHWISLILPNQKKIVIGNVYRPPQGNVKVFCDKLDEQLIALRISQKQNIETFILGDFNINYLTPSNSDTKLLKWFEQKSSLKQIIKDITRFSNLNSCIDLIFTDSLSLSSYGTLDVNLSDHEMIYVTRKHVKKNKASTSFIGRSYLDYNEDLFISRLLDIDWNIFYTSIDAETAWKSMKDNILKVLDIMCPYKKYNVKQVKDPWISNEILECIHDKDRLLSRAKHINDPNDWKIARRRRNEVKNLTKRAKANFINDNLENYRNDSKKFWKSLSDILPTKSNKNSQQIFLKDENDELVLDNKTAANMMNDFFTSIGPNLAKDMTDPWVYTGETFENNIDDMFTDRQEVLKLIKDIDTTKASAVPNIASKILKPALIALIDQITFIFNLCLSQNIFPNEWKIASIVPLPKEGDLSKCTNYRPISLLPLPGKILEHIMHSRIISLCDNVDILNKNQGGFRKKTLYD